MFFEWLMVASVVLPVTAGYCYCHRQRMRMLTDTNESRLKHLTEMERISLERERRILDEGRETDADRVQKRLISVGETK